MMFGHIKLLQLLFCQASCHNTSADRRLNKSCKVPTRIFSCKPWGGECMSVEKQGISLKINHEDLNFKRVYIIHCSAELEAQGTGKPIQQKSVQYTDPFSVPDLRSIESVESRRYMPLIHIQTSIVSLQSSATLILSHTPQEIVLLYLLPPRLPHRCI